MLLLVCVFLIILAGGAVSVAVGDMCLFVPLCSRHVVSLGLGDAPGCRGRHLCKPVVSCVVAGSLWWGFAVGVVVVCCGGVVSVVFRSVGLGSCGVRVRLVGRGGQGEGYERY